MPILSHWPNWPQELRELHREMRRLFDESLSGFLDRRASSRRFPPINVYETDEEVVVRAEVPGVSVAELDLSVTGDTLALAGERRLELPEGASFLAQERQHGRFRRVVALPRSVDAQEAKAEYVDGVLTVRLRKAPGARPRTIEVKTE
ncbi:MAG: Hsp20/alpha crystallin family protein [Planctomycetes bacterium]|nr:Hsp20/alpha crystallin family protein [Planctomycetota bacterium]